MIIDQLPEIGSVQSTDEMPIERGQTTYKTPVSKIFASPTLTGTPKAPTAGVSTDNTQIATTAFANRAANNAVSTFARPNLLDNWYFVGGGSQSGYGVFPINQRGQTIYSTHNDYGIDRWKLRFDNGGSFTVGADGVTVSGGAGSMYMVQTYPNGGKDLCGKTVTFSVWFASLTGSAGIVVGNATNAIYTGTAIGAKEIDSTGLATLTVNIPSTLSNAYLNFIISCASGSAYTVSAAKLEIGSEQTLAHQENGAWVLNEIPNYSEELAKCQAYFIRIAPLELTQYAILSPALALSGTRARAFIPLPVRLKGVPTVSSNGAFQLTPDLNATVEVTAISYYSVNTCAVGLNIDVASGLTAGNTYFFRTSSGYSQYIDVSAEP